MEDDFKLLMPTSVITDKMDKIIEAFVKYYGENRREEITSKLKSVLLLKFSSTDSLKNNISKIKANLFRRVYGISEDSYLFFNYDEFFDLLEVKDLDTNYFPYLGGEIKEIITGSKDIEPEEIYKGFKEGKYPKLEEFLKLYKPLREKLKPYEEQVEREEEKEKELEDKYFEILLSEFSYLFNEEDIEKYHSIGFPPTEIVDYLGFSIDTLGHCFDDEHETKLNDPSSEDWEKEDIIKERLKFLKNHITLSDPKYKLNPPNYEDYLNNPESKEFIEKTRAICEKITRRKKELNDLKTIEIIEGLEDYKKNRAEIEKRNFVNKNDMLGPFVYNSPVSCYEENFVLTPSGYVLSPLILINSGTGELDCTIIHELNHAFEQETITINESGCISRTGWDDSTIKFLNHKEYDQMQYSGITRKYELLSEYVNDRLAQEITDVFHSMGDYIFSPKRGNSSSGYIMVSIIAEDFFKEFKDIIIKSRSHNNIGYLFEQIGKDYFEELNDIINEFYNSFGLNFGAMSVICDYKNNVVNDNTIHLGQLIEKKNELMNKMREHKMNSTISIN